MQVTSATTYIRQHYVSRETAESLGEGKRGCKVGEKCVCSKVGMGLWDYGVIGSSGGEVRH